MSKKIKNILVLEDESYYKGLLHFNNDCFNVTYNGMLFYKYSDKFLLKFDLIINFTYNSDLMNYIVSRANFLHIYTLLIADGIFEWSNAFNNRIFKNNNLILFHPIIHDSFMCVGENERNYFNYNGIKTLKYLPIRMKPRLKKIGHMNTDRFLITTSNTSYFTNHEKKSLLELLNKIIKTLEVLNKPYSFRIFDEYLINKLSINNKINITEGDFEQCLKNHDFIITTSSSISYLAMFHDKPVAHIQYRDTPVFIRSGWNINSIINLSQTIQSMLERDKHRMKFQRFQVLNYNSSNPFLENTISFEKNQQKIVDLNPSILKLLNSKYNFNFEYSMRKIFLLLKKNKILKNLFNKLK